MNLFRRAVAEVEDDQLTIMNTRVRKFVKKLVEVTPVDTGAMKSMWAYDPTVKWQWRLTNTVESEKGFHYGGLIGQGRRTVNGKTYGSLQLPHGYLPYIQEFRGGSI